MGLTTPALEETGKSCHFTAGGVPLQALYFVSRKEKKVPEEICEGNNRAVGAAGCGKIYLASRLSDCFFLDIKTQAFHPPDLEKHIPLHFHKSAGPEKSPSVTE